MTSIGHNLDTGIRPAIGGAAIILLGLLLGLLLIGSPAPEALFC